MKNSLLNGLAYLTLRILGKKGFLCRSSLNWWDFKGGIVRNPQPLKHYIRKRKRRIGPEVEPNGNMKTK